MSHMQGGTELSEAFYPCVPRGLVDEWHRLNLVISESRKDREAPARELLRLSVEGADMNVEPQWRLGAIVEGTDCKVQAVWHLTDDGRRWMPRLEYVRGDNERN